MNRRQLLRRAAAITGCAWVLPQLAEFQAPAVQAEAVPERCSDCAMTADQMPVPEAFAPAPANSPYMDMVRRSVHEMAVREQISHSEAGIRVYWQAFPSYTVESDAIADARAEGYVRGWDVRDAAAESTATALRLRRSDGTTKRIPATVTAWWDGAEGQSLRGFRT